MIGGSTAVAGQVKSRRESVKTKNQSQGSKETNNLEYFHYFTYNSTYLKWFQKAFQKDGQIHQPVSCLL